MSPADAGCSQPKGNQQLGSSKPARPVVQSASAADAAKELAQFAKWLEKDSSSRKPFEFRVLDEGTAAELVKATGGGAAPKVSLPSRPPLYSRVR